MIKQFIRETIEAACKDAVDALPHRFQWTPHNLISHPLSEWIYISTGRYDIANWIHDLTIPTHEPGTGRG